MHLPLPTVPDASDEPWPGADPQPARWIGWRVRALAACVVAVCLALALLAHWRMTDAAIPGTWRLDDQGRVTLVQAFDAQHRALEGDVLLAFGPADRDAMVEADPALMHRSPRWIVHDDQRLQHHGMQEALDDAMASGAVRMRFLRAGDVSFPIDRLGLRGLGMLFWLVAAMAGVLAMMAAIVMLSRPTWRNLPYLAMCLGQAGVLTLVALESVPTLGIGHDLADWDARLRPALDVASAAALAISVCLFPTRLPQARALTAWLSALAAVAVVVLVATPLPFHWWWTQVLCLGFAVALIVLLRLSQRQRAHPMTTAIVRFAAVALGGWLVLSLATAYTAGLGATGQNVATVASVVWSVFSASMLLLMPFLSRSQYLMREFALVAGVSTAATMLDLLFVSIFAIGEFASLTLALFFALALYGPARQWLIGRLRRESGGSMERVFEHLYRVTREVQSQPQHLEPALSRLLRDLYQPLECVGVDRTSARPWVVSDGSTLYVPLPALTDSEMPPRRAIKLRFARQGRRLFSSDDARLAYRLTEQLRQMVAYDQAVERGRTEERSRIAQDLHDDIGARLLTLIYKSPSAEMEEYVRHTLQDLKTLTRGLAAGEQRLSHAAAEWKSDLTHRLELAGIELDWSASLDADPELNVTQWSGLTRVLRELANNTIAHAEASGVLITLTLVKGELVLQVRDNGSGSDPSAWSHGLGLGGVRKRVKQLGGTVQWTEAAPRGIQCDVRIPLAATEGTERQAPA